MLLLVQIICLEISASLSNPSGKVCWYRLSHTAETETAWDVYHDSFGETLRLSESLTSDTNYYHNVNLSLVLIFSLHEVTWRFRWLHLRHQGQDPLRCPGLMAARYGVA